MRVSKKMMESLAVAGLAAVLTITSITTSGESAPGRMDTVELAQNGIAGVTAAFNEYQLNVSEERNIAVGVEQEIAGIVTSALNNFAEESDFMVSGQEELDVFVPEEPEENPIEDEVTLTQEEAEWQDKLMPDVKEFLNIRAEASPNAKLVGKLYKGARAVVKEIGSEWTKITSGSVTGYVKNAYCLYGADALAYARKNCDRVAQATVNGLRVRSEANQDSRVVMTLADGDRLTVVSDVESAEGWVAVKVNTKTCYVSADYVTLTWNTGKAVSIKEEAAMLAASKSSSQKPSSGMTQGASLAATADEETLLAALIDCEVGNCSLECMIAVGAVVINRVRSNLYPNDIYSVIYQSRQFGPAGSGRLERRLATGASALARQAAKEALSGKDPTGGAMYFKLKSSGHSGVVIGPVVFY